MSTFSIRLWVCCGLRPLQDRLSLFIAILIVAILAERTIAAADATTRFATRLKTPVQADGDHFGADSEENNVRFDEDADAVFHVELSVGVEEMSRVGLM